MSSADRSPQSRAPQSSERDASAARPAVGAHMLEQILSLTSGDTPQAGFVEATDVQAVTDVARQLAGQPFSLEPVAVELVHAMLLAQFRKAGLSSSALRAMAEQLAATLYDDPASRQRLEALWIGLTQQQS